MIEKYPVQRIATGDVVRVVLVDVEKRLDVWTSVVVDTGIEYVEVE